MENNKLVAEKLENYMALVQRTMIDDTDNFDDDPGHMINYRRRRKNSTLFGGDPWPFISRYLPIFSSEYRYLVNTKDFVGEGQLKHGSFVRIKTNNVSYMVSMTGPSLNVFFDLPQSLVALLFHGKYENRSYEKPYSYTRELYDEDIWYVWRQVIADIRKGKFVTD